MSMSRPKKLGRWLRRNSLTLVAALGGAAGVAYAAGRHTAPVVDKTPPMVASVIAGPDGNQREPEKQDVVQIALLLDTSGSMDGLINQARSHLWNIVDQMGKMSRIVDGKPRGVRVELALYEYGNDTIAASDGYIRQVMPLTTDLDSVSEKLQGLFTNGGSEFAGQAIATAVDKLQWSSDPDAMRFIFVAGNEGFEQGPVTALAAMQAAEKRDISVQLIHCGTSDSTWSAAAKLAHSDLTTIDQDRVAQHVPAPQDDEILRLGDELNATYMAYGSAGQASMARQKGADFSSAKMSKKVAVERAQLKSKKSYDNTNWDVVDATTKDKNWLSNAKDADLPADMQGKTLVEKQALVDANAKKRADIKTKIAKLEAERSTFLTNERAKTGAKEEQQLDTELMKSTRKVAGKKGYK